MSPMRKVGRPPLSGASGQTAAQEIQATAEATIPITEVEPEADVALEPEAPAAAQDATAAQPAEMPGIEEPEVERKADAVLVPEVGTAAIDTAAIDTAAIEAADEVDVDLADNGEGRRGGLLGRLFSRKR